MDLSERLRYAIEQSPLSIRKFHEEIAGQDVPGSSYPVIYRYLKGEAKPPVKFLEAAAKILGVRPVWLILGEGKPTEREEFSNMWEQDESTGPVVTVAHLIAEGFPAFQTQRSWVQGVMVATWDRYLYARQSSGTVEDLSRQFGRALAAPLVELGIDPAQMDRERLEQYVLSTCQALMQAVQ